MFALLAGRSSAGDQSATGGVSGLGSIGLSLLTMLEKLLWLLP